MIGRRFDAVAAKIHEIIARAGDYGDFEPGARIDIFQNIGKLLEGDRGFGFRVRQTASDRAILENWIDVLGWWMHAPGIPAPDPESLRAWQRFVADNLEFRLGVAIGAVVAQAWSADAFTTPSLTDWKETTGLPWFGFWARELLRWGTHDPFVAFCLSQGVAQTRESALARRGEFNAWLEDLVKNPDAESRIDPQRFIEWEKSRLREEHKLAAAGGVQANLTGTDGGRGRYPVIPVVRGDETLWLDPAGFQLAVSPVRQRGGVNRGRSDFELRVAGDRATVERVFRPS